MKPHRLLFVCLVAVATQTGQAQDIMAEHRIAALKGLRSVAVIFRPTDPTQVVFPARSKEIGDFITVELARSIPALKTNGSAASTPDWVEVEFMIADRASVLAVRVYRWVSLRGSKTEFQAATWEDHKLFVGTVTVASVKEALQPLLTSFSADYIRANQ